MNKFAVSSTTLAALGYDAAAQTLEVEFKPGHPSLRFFDVPWVVYASLVRAAYKDAYFDANIRHAFRSTSAT